MHATGIKPVAKKLREVSGRVDTRTLKHWLRLAQANGGVVVETRGKKRAEQFEIALLSELVCTRLGGRTKDMRAGGCYWESK